MRNAILRGRRLAAAVRNRVPHWFVLSAIALSGPGAEVARSAPGPATNPASASTSEPELTPQQEKQLKQRNRLVGQMNRLLRDDDIESAVKLGEQVLAIDQAIFGADSAESLEMLDNLVVLYGSVGQWESAIAKQGDVVSIHAKTFGPFDRRTTAARIELDTFGRLTRLTPEQQVDFIEARLRGEEALQLGRTDRAKAVSEANAAYAEIEKLLGTGTLHLALFGANLADLLRSGDKPAAAAVFYDKAVTVGTREFGAEHPFVADLFLRQAKLLQRLGQTADALKLAEQALAIDEKTLGPEALDTGRCLYHVGGLCLQTDAVSRSSTLLQRSLPILSRELGEEDQETLDNQIDLADALRRLGDYPAALPPAEQALSGLEKLRGPEDVETALAARRLATLCSLTAQYERSRELYERALSILERGLGPEHDETLITQNNLAILFIATGELAKAIPLLEHSLTATEKLLGPDSPETAACLSNLAEGYRATGDHAKAVVLYERALAVMRKAGEPRIADAAVLMNNLAQMQQTMGKTREARALLGEAIEILRTKQGPEHPQTAMALANLANACSLEGDFDRATALGEQSLAIYKKLFGVEHPTTAQVMHNLAYFSDRQGDYPKALALYQEALAAKAKYCGPDHPETALTRGSLALCRLALGQSDGVFNEAAQAFDAMQRHTTAIAIVQSERQQLAAASLLQANLNTLLSVSLKAGADVASTYGRVIGWKGAVTARQRMDRAAVRSAGKDPAAAKRYAELQQTARRLATLESASPPETSDQKAARVAEMVQLSDTLERLQRDLAAQSVEFAAEMRRRSATPQDLGATLAADEALVDLYEYECFTPPVADAEASWSTRLVAFVLRNDGVVRRVELGDVAEITALIDRWRQSYGAGSAGEQAGADLRAKLVEPLLQMLDGVKALRISPDGALCRLPWGALPGKQPKTFLLEDLAVSVVAIPQLMADPPPAPADKKEAEEPTLLLIGDVDFGDPRQGADNASLPEQRGELAPDVAEASLKRSAARAAEPLKYAPLKASRDEVLAVRDSFELRFDDGNVELQRRDKATEEAFREEAPSARFIHLATHGFFSPPNVRSALKRPAQDGQAPAPTTPDRDLTGWHPGLLSGIVLANANIPPADLDQDDGVLTALEIGELDLSRVQLAVLSACETGLGESAGGEGLLGLQRAFQVAGARSVIASLWSVPDDQTQRLMSEFYRNLWEKKMGQSEALRQAQIHMLRQGVDRGMQVADGEEKPKFLPPYYWAAFVLSGDSR